jgi:hypothetical protein
MFMFMGSHHVHGLRVVAEEVSDPPSLLDVVLGVGLQRMNHVGELHAVTDEKHWDVVAHHVEVALACVELDSKATGVTQRLWTPTLMDHSAAGKQRGEGKLEGRGELPKDARTSAHA